MANRFAILNELNRRKDRQHLLYFRECFLHSDRVCTISYYFLYKVSDLYFGSSNLVSSKAYYLSSEVLLTCDLKAGNLPSFPKTSFCRENKFFIGTLGSDCGNIY